MKFHGLGLACVNAASESLTIESDNGRSLWRCEYSESVKVASPMMFPTSGRIRSRVCVKLTDAIFHKAPDEKVLIRVLVDQSYLYPHLGFSLNKHSIGSKRGLIDCAEKLLPAAQARSSRARSFTFRKSFDNFLVDAAALGEVAGRPIVKSWANGVQTDFGGAHLDSFNKALSSVGWQPAVMVIHIVMNQPEYAGPTRERLEVPEFELELIQILKHALSNS